MKQCSIRQYPLVQIYTFVHSHHMFALTMYINFKEKHNFGVFATWPDKICHPGKGMNGIAQNITTY